MCDSRGHSTALYVTSCSPQAWPPPPALAVSAVRTHRLYSLCCSFHPRRQPVAGTPDASFLPSSHMIRRSFVEFLQCARRGLHKQCGHLAVCIPRSFQARCPAGTDPGHVPADSDGVVVTRAPEIVSWSKSLSALLSSSGGLVAEQTWGSLCAQSCSRGLRAPPAELPLLPAWVGPPSTLNSPFPTDCPFWVFSPRMPEPCDELLRN